MTCFALRLSHAVFWTLELTRRRNLTVSISFGCLAQERQSEVIGSVVKKACAKVCFLERRVWLVLVFRDTGRTSFYLT